VAKAGAGAFSNRKRNTDVVGTATGRRFALNCHFFGIVQLTSAKNCPVDSSRSPHVGTGYLNVQMCASQNHRKKMKVEPSRPIARKTTVNLVVLIVQLSSVCVRGSEGEVRRV